MDRVNDEAPDLLGRGFVRSIGHFDPGLAAWGDGIRGLAGGGSGIGAGATGADRTGAGATTAAGARRRICRRRRGPASAGSGVRATPATPRAATIQSFRNMVHPPGRSVRPTNQEVMLRP